MARALSTAMAAWSLGCGATATGNEASPEAPGPGIAVTRATRLSPTEGGPLVRLQRLTLPADESLLIQSSPTEEVFVFIEEGRLGPHGEGSVLRLRGEVVFPARGETTVVAAIVERTGERPIGAPNGAATGDASSTTVRAVTVDNTPALANAGGRLEVRIFHDEANGASNGAFSLLEADAGLPVPEHAHEESVEALFILEGDGVMVLGDERFPLEAGRVIYIPAGTTHGYEAGSGPMRALQVYAPPGPEQRFRAAPPAPAPVDPGE